MSLPRITGENLKKPLSYDPARKKFIYYDELVNGTEAVVPVQTLRAEEQKRLVLERHRRGPDFTEQAISGPRHTRDDVVTAIEQGTDFGQTAVAAEISYLQELLEQIAAHLKSQRKTGG